jgi:hypothetical protein
MTPEFICLRFRLTVTSYSVRWPPSQGLAKFREPPRASQPPIPFTVGQRIADSRRRLQRHAAGQRRQWELSLGDFICLSPAKCALGRSRQSLFYRLGWARSDAACGASEGQWRITLRRTLAFSCCGSAGTRFSHAVRSGGCTQKVMGTSIRENWMVL